MKRLVGWSVLAIVSFAACTTEVPRASEGASTTPTVLTTATPANTPSANHTAPTELIGYPAGTRTGNATVDAVVDALLANDVLAVQALARFQAHPCSRTTTNDFTGPPPRCPEGVPEGSPLEIMTSNGCHGGYLLRDDFDGRLFSPRYEYRLYAVLSPRTADDERVEHAIVFGYQIDNGDTWGIAVSTGAGGILAVDGGCGFSPQEMVERYGSTEFLLPPPDGGRMSTDPASLAPVPFAGPSLGNSAPIDFGDARIEPLLFSGTPILVPDFPPATTPVLLYDSIESNLWMLDGTAAYGLTFSPFGEQAIATAFWAVSSMDRGSTEPETVLIDLDDMSVRRLLPVNAEQVRWVSSSIIRLTVREAREHERRHDWPPGAYEIDLAANTVQLVAEQGQVGSLSPNGQFELVEVPQGRDAQRLVLRDLASGHETEVHRFTGGESLAGIAWTGGGGLFFQTTEPVWRTYRWQAGDASAVLVHEEQAPVDGWLPSADGRYLAVSGSAGTTIVDVDDGSSVVGTFPETLPAAWHPKRPGTLMLLDAYCVNTGHEARLAQFDATTGALSPVASGNEGFWDFHWSGRGDVGVGWTATGIYLVDAAANTADRLDWPDAFAAASAPVQRWIVWSADGQWLSAFGMDGGHGDPCYLRDDR